MDTSRRNFLQMAGMAMASALVPGASHAAESAVARAALRGLSRGERIRKGGWPILQGPTDDASTTIILLHPRAEQFRCELSGLGDRGLSHALVDRWDLPGSTFAVTELFVAGLVPGESCRLRVLGENGALIDERSFGALDTRKEECRFAVASCMSDYIPHRTTSMWETLQNERCDFVFLVGDTCYADNDNPHRDEAGYSRRYAEARSRLGWFRMPRLTPTFATWDDHDYGLNNSDASLPQKAFTQQLFRRFFGVTGNQSWKPSSFGVGSALEVCGQRFYLLDDRSFRAPAGEIGGRHWGGEQTDWLLADLARSDRPAWLLNGSQFYGGYLGKESFEGDHAEDFANFRASLRRVSAPVAFISGDVHFSEVMKIDRGDLGYETYEFTSSSMHSLTFPWHQHRQTNPRRLDSEWRHNFLVFDVSTRGGWEMGVRCVTDGNATSFSRRLQIHRG